MNSRLYACDIMHDRLEPKANRFHYRIFMFYLDLDELEACAQRFWVFSRNAFNIFDFRDTDHLQRGFSTTKENILNYLESKGLFFNNPRIMLLTHLRTFGYIFNPVSFYFCFEGNSGPVCAVAEVGNTFREMKPYYLGPETRRDKEFFKRCTKYFYVSPFIDLDSEFEFRLSNPDDRLSIYIDDYKRGRKFFLSSLTGERRDLSNQRLLSYVFRFPWITLQIIFFIHWQALVLWLKRVPHVKKKANPHLQQEVYHGRDA